MITRTARNDVVRVIRTGEIGVVKGWADHEKLAQNGTILDIEIGRGQTIQANGNALELVASAKLKAHWVATTLVILVSAAASSWIGWNLAKDGVSAVQASLLGLLLYPGFDRLLVSMFLRRKTRVTLPVRVKVAQGVRAQGRNPISKG